MRIGILTLFHENYNWGGVLQGYALKKYLEQEFKGTCVDILRYNSGTNIIYKNKAMQALQYSPKEIAGRFYKKFASKIANEKSDTYDLSGRKRLFDSFMETYQTNPLIYHDSTLSYAAEDYDLLVCGSDQIWNPNVARPGYFLSMVGNQCVKASYAASIARDDLSEHEKKIMIPLIEAFDFVSVREKTAKNFLDKYVEQDTEIVEVLDPSMMIAKNQWVELASDIEPDPSDYALAFFFSDSLAYREMVIGYCEEAGYKLKFIPFAKEALENDLRGPGERVTDIGPREFIALFRDAKMIFTDSFHGSVFSILFEKPFCVFERDKQTKVSKNSRLYDLLEKFNVSNRLISSEADLNEVLEQKIDYNQIGILLQQYRAYSHAYIEQCICAARSRGEKNLQDTESLAPVKDIISPYKDAYVGYHLNNTIRKHSSSGGMFYTLALCMLKEHGVVYGAAWSDQHTVAHKRVTSKSELRSLLGSKYVQSQIGNCFKEIEADLSVGRQVLFSGTPCQVLGVKQYLSKKKVSMEKLLLVDFICHGVPSPEVWNSYVSFRENGKDIKRINFRDKSKGWHDYHMRFDYKNGESYKQSHDLDPFMRTFLSDKNIRPSCYLCLTKDAYYASDLTLGDAWKIEKENSQWADDKGTSLFVIRSDKGRSVMDKLDKEFLFAACGYERWSWMNPSLREPTNLPGNRKDFFEDYKSMDAKSFWEKYSEISRKDKSRYGAKKLIKKSGLEKIVRKMI